MDSYSVLGALIAGFSLQLVSSVGRSDFDEQPIWIFSVCFTLCGTLTSVFALYATLIFALNSLHGKASIGMHKDGGYLQYITETAPYREYAFLALMASFVGLVATLLFMLFLKGSVITAAVACFAVIVFVHYGFRHVKEVMSLAK